MESLNIFFILQLLSNFWMVAIILFVQFVHYPLFYHVDNEHMPLFSQNHQSRILFVVIPPMIAEVISYISLLTLLPDSVLLLLSGICLFLIWGSTFFLQVPCHQILLERKEVTTIKKLNQTNYIRTILWPIKFILLLALYIRI